MQQQIVTNYNSSSVDRTQTETNDRTFSNYFTRSWDTIQIKVYVSYQTKCIQRIV